MASVARYCCCGGCAESLEVTFSNVDAAICSACSNDGTNSWKANSISIDGVYTLTKVQDNASICAWENSSINSSDWYFGGGTTCAPADALHDGTGSSSVIRLVYTKSSGKYTSIVVAHTQFVYAAFDFAWYGSSDLGDTLNNSLACGTLGVGTEVPLSNGGTAVVALP